MFCESWKIWEIQIYFVDFWLQKGEKWRWFFLSVTQSINYSNNLSYWELLVLCSWWDEESWEENQGSSRRRKIRFLRRKLQLDLILIMKTWWTMRSMPVCEWFCTRYDYDLLNLQIFCVVHAQLSFIIVLLVYFLWLQFTRTEMLYHLT